MPLVASDLVASVPSLMQQARVVVRDAPGYNHLTCGRLMATLIEATTTDNEQLLIVIMGGGQVSNDHLPHYELLFDRSTQPTRLLSSRQWYFDVAGIEGLTFERVGLTLAIASQLLLLPIFIAIIVIRRFSPAARMRRGCCPACKHDLRHDFASGCSECGWRRVEHAMYPADIRHYASHRVLLRRIMRPRAVLTAVVVLLSVLACWWAHSLPGGVPFWQYVTPRALVVALVIVLIKFIATFFVADRSRRFAARVWLLMLLAWGIGTLAALPSRLPLRFRFIASEASLNERISRGGLMPGRVGWYRVRHVAATSDFLGTVVWVCEPHGGQTERGALMYYPGTLPDQPSFASRRIELRPLRGDWYLFEYR
jgi:hypothetical protein